MNLNIRTSKTQAKLTNIRKHQHGFSLLELAIALAVLALLVGGVLQGRELLASARVQAAITDMSNIETAIAGFQSRYNALPGDFAAAPAANLGILSGDGNGQVDSVSEEVSVFDQLQKAGFIEGNFTPTAQDARCTPTNCMVSQFGGTYNITSSASGQNTRANALVMVSGDAAPARLMAELDRKLDDGNPSTGRVQLLALAPAQAGGQAPNANCLAGNGNNWNEANNVECQAVYVLQ